MTDALSVWGCGSNIFGQLGQTSSQSSSSSSSSSNPLISSTSQNQSSLSPAAGSFGSSQPHSPLRGQSPSIGGSGIANNGNLVTPFSKKNSAQVHGGGIKQIQSKSGSNNVPFIPLKAIDAFQSPNQVECISCGAQHCMALTTNGELYSWGLGCEGQLSQNNYKNYQTPALVQVMTPNGAANLKASNNDNESTSAERKAPQLEEGVANSLLSYLKRTTTGGGGSRNIGMNSRGKSQSAQRGQNIAGPGGFNKTVGGYTYMQDRLGGNNRAAPTLDLGSSRNSYQQQPPQLGGTTGKLGRQKVSLSSSSNQNDLSSNKFSKSMDFSNASRVEGSSIDDNSLFALQQHQMTQIYLMKQNQQVSEIACGAVHSIVRTNFGRVFACGFGGSFALGTQTNQTINKFEQISSLTVTHHANAKKIACGMYHSGCVSQDGRVFLWGMFTKSSKDKENLIFTSPTSIIGFGSVNSSTNSNKSQSSQTKRRLSSVSGSSQGQVASDLALGEHFSIILTESGKLYSIGSNTCGQLGVQLSNNQGEFLDQSINPVHINSIPKQISQVACGSKHVLAISTDYQLYAWGYNAYGQLGLRTSSSSSSSSSSSTSSSSLKYISRPTKVSNFQDAQPFKVACGSYHSICLSYAKPKLSKNPQVQAMQQQKQLQSAIQSYFQPDDSKDKIFDKSKRTSGAGLTPQLPINQQLMSKLMLEIQTLKRALTIEKANGQSLQKQLDESQKKLLSLANRDLSPREKQALKKKQQKRDDPLAAQLQHRYLPPNFEINHDDLIFEKQISEGGCGKVYKGKWKHTLVAIKQIKKQIIHQDKLDEFINECSIMEAVRHPNIVMFLGASTRPPKLCIVLQFCPRGSLWNLLHDFQFKLGWQIRRKIALDIAKGVYYLHSFPVPVLHRDLKSLNVLLDVSYNAKLADFGWTRIKANVMTAKIGTYQWMAPEVIVSHKYTQKADVFSFGVLLWELATRKPPYYGMQGTQVGRKVVQQNLRPKISQKQCPMQFLTMMRRCWDKDPNKRPSFKEIIVEMESYNFKHLDQSSSQSSHKK